MEIVLFWDIFFYSQYYLSMRTIIHDLEDTSFLNLGSEDVLVSDVNNSCIGCFNCWVKTPFWCIHKDKIINNGKLILDSDELIIISKCNNGCYSSKVKRILERSISYVEPFFTIRNKEIHHLSRTPKKLGFKVYFYGDKITVDDKRVAELLVEANMRNLNTTSPTLYFYNSYKEINL